MERELSKVSLSLSAFVTRWVAQLDTPCDVQESMVQRSIVVLLAAVAASALSTVSASATYPGKNGRLAITAWMKKEGCRSQATVFTVKPDGTDMRKLTRDTCANRQEGHGPTWSPDGRRLMYWRGFDRYSEPSEFRYVVTDARGARERLFRLPDGVRFAQAVWGPSDDLFAWEVYFSEKEQQERDGIYVGSLTNLTRQYLGNTFFGLRKPTWSPDGTQLAVEDHLDDDLPRCSQLALIDVASAERHALVTARTSIYGCANVAYMPDWSPNGRQIAYAGTGWSKTAAWENGKIFVIDVKTGQRRRLTSGRGHDSNPVWSPDGKWIAFLHSGPACCDRTDLYVMRSDGTRERRIARGVIDVAWQPRV